MGLPRSADSVDESVRVLISVAQRQRSSNGSPLSCDVVDKDSWQVVSIEASWIVPESLATADALRNEQVWLA